MTDGKTHEKVKVKKRKSQKLKKDATSNPKCQVEVIAELKMEESILTGLSTPESLLPALESSDVSFECAPDSFFEAYPFSKAALSLLEAPQTCSFTYVPHVTPSCTEYEEMREEFPSFPSLSSFLSFQPNQPLAQSSERYFKDIRLKFDSTISSPLQFNPLFLNVEYISRESAARLGMQEQQRSDFPLFPFLSNQVPLNLHCHFGTILCRAVEESEEEVTMEAVLLFKSSKVTKATFEFTVRSVHKEGKKIPHTILAAIKSTMQMSMDEQEEYISSGEFGKHMLSF